MIKTLARTAAALSFTCFLLAGLTILLNARVPEYRDGFVLVCIGLLFVGTAFFVGPMLWLAAERWAPKEREQAPATSAGPWAWKVLLGTLGVIIVVMVLIYHVRVSSSSPAERVRTATISQ